MERFLTEYINRIRPLFPGFQGSAAHEIASAFLAFRFGLYTTSARECTHAISLIPDSGANNTLKKALSIIRANAEDLENAKFSADISIGFSDEDRTFMPISLLPEQIEDPGSLALDNALVLIYCVALLTSPDDEDALSEHRKYVIRLLSGYKKALGLS